MDLAWHLTFGNDFIFPVTIDGKHPDIPFLSAKYDLLSATLIDKNKFHLIDESDEGILYTALLGKDCKFIRLFKRVEHSILINRIVKIPVIVYREYPFKRSRYLFGYPDRVIRTTNSRFHKRIEDE